VTYTNIGNEKDMGNPPRQECTIRRKIIYLIAELRDNSQCILQERHNNQKPANSRHISVSSSDLFTSEGSVLRLHPTHIVLQEILKLAGVVFDLVERVGECWR